MISGIITGQDIVDEIIILEVMPVIEDSLFLYNHTIDNIVSLFNINISTTHIIWEIVGKPISLPSAIGWHIKKGDWGT